MAALKISRISRGFVSSHAGFAQGTWDRKRGNPGNHAVFFDHAPTKRPIDASAKLLGQLQQGAVKDTSKDAEKKQKIRWG